jgi:NADPH-dependent glutamate synthase beta subunit-like oxidoreductase
MDAVRTANRLGKEAWLVYRRAREQMPANKEEVTECEEESINFCYLTNPKKIHGITRVEGMECCKMALGPLDESGRAKPIPVQDSDFKIDADTIIEAISQEPDLEGFNGEKFKTGKGNTFVVDEMGMTSIKGVFAGGDCVIGPSTIVEAFRSIKTTSIGIHKFLMGKLPPGITEETKPVCACQK